MDNILKRRSIRQFKDTKIDHDILVKICEAGFYAPSAKNQCLREFLIVDDLNKLQQLSNASPGARHLKGVKQAIVVLGINDPLASAFMMNAQDLAASTQNILLAATSYGIGSLWIGIHPVLEREENVKKVLDIKDNLYPFSIIALGYPLNEDDLKVVDKVNKSKIHYNKV